MSIKLMSAVWDIPDPELNGARLLTLLCLADHAGDDGLRCYPSVPRLAERSKVSERQVTRVLRWLEAKDYIRIIAKGEGRGNVTQYYLWLKGDVLSLNTRKGDKVSSYSHQKAVKGDTSDVKGDICDIEKVTFEQPITPILGGDPSIESSSSLRASHDDDEWKEVVDTMHRCGVTLNGHMSEEYQDMLNEFGKDAVVLGLRNAADNGKAGILKYVRSCVTSAANGFRPEYSNGKGATFVALAEGDL